MLKTKIIFLLLLVWGVACRADTDSRYMEYIRRWAPEAVRQQEKYRIPASVTLAQGLLESAAGRSTLATEGNNHFGIKCHSTWEGATMLRSDDAPDECFRVYPTPEESFTDHSLFLSRRRYASLFSLAADDYRGWAEGLSRCGYATDPQYAMRLVAIIERYSLSDYDLHPAGGSAPGDTEYILGHLTSGHRVLRARGLHYVIAGPGDTYASIAREFHTDGARLAGYNDAASAEDEVRAWQEVYLQPKLTEGPEGVEWATIGQDESLHSVAQRYGMTVAALRALNPGARDTSGTRLRLRRRR